MRTEPPRQHLYLSSLLWNGFWIIQQPICNEIQKEEAVLFVEQPVSVFTVLRYPGRWRRLFAWLRGARRVSPTLRVLAPLPLFHLGHRFPGLFRLEFALQRQWILLWLGRPPAGGRVLWIDHPLFESAIGRMGESLSVYHVGDEPGEFATSHRPTIAPLEERALRKASVVFAAAEELARARRPKNPNTFAIANAIDVSVFGREPPGPAPADVARIPTPRVGFIGVLDTWVDLDLLAATARALPDVQVVIVGPSRVDDQVLRALPNVHFLGPRDRQLVPGILRLVSASLVPFVANALTARIVPAKVFEALAAGIVPVCTAFSSNLDEFERQHRVLVARSAPEYVELVRQAIAADTPARRAELAGFGMRQTWGDRWREMSGILRGLEPPTDARRAGHGVARAV